MLSKAQRGLVCRWSMWAVRQSNAIHYAEIRPMPATLVNLPTTTDCSGFATLVYKSAGAPDPNGLNYNGFGYTGTLLQHMKQIRWWSRRPGDLCVYGPGTGHHVAIYMEPRGIGDALMCSHGREQGPELVLQSAMKKGQPAPVRWLRLP